MRERKIRRNAWRKEVKELHLNHIEADVLWQMKYRKGGENRGRVGRAISRFKQRAIVRSRRDEQNKK